MRPLQDSGQSGRGGGRPGLTAAEEGPPLGRALPAGSAPAASPPPSTAPAIFTQTARLPRVCRAGPVPSGPLHTQTLLQDPPALQILVPALPQVPVVRTPDILS